MTKKLILLCIAVASPLVSALSQEWSKEDSTWLINVLEGKDIKINEETKKAIEDGRLIAPSWMKNADNGLNLIEVIDAGVVDSLRIQSIDPYSMPPAVYALYVLYMEKMDSISEERSLVLTQSERESLEATLPPGVRGGTITGAVNGLDFNHFFSTILSPSYRRMVHNRKYAVNYKYYYDENATRKPPGFTERERQQLRKSLNKSIISITTE